MDFVFGGRNTCAEVRAEVSIISFPFFPWNYAFIDAMFSVSHIFLDSVDVHKNRCLFQTIFSFLNSKQS